MPFYMFRIILRDRKLLAGIRLLPSHNIDIIWRTYKTKVQNIYRYQMQSFEVIQLSKLDPRVQAWVRDRAKNKPDDIFNEFTTDAIDYPHASLKRMSGPGKYRNSEAQHVTLQDRKGGPSAPTC